MTRDEVLDLLPLYAGGDLDDGDREAVRAALEADPSLADEARAWDDLDGLLARGLAPDEANAPAPGPPRITVRRRCPFCHDALQAGSIALCAACATPHHAACFAQHHGCSLLGCGGTRAVEVGGPESVVCAGCERHTPAGAPFCAWCGAPTRDDLRPRHEVAMAAAAPPAWSPRRYLAAAALLLASTFGMGGFFGLQQLKLLEALETTGTRLQSVDERLRARDAEALMPQVLEAVHLAQDLLRQGRLGDGRGELAPDLRTLVEAARRSGWGDFQPLLEDWRWRGHYEVVVRRSPTSPRERFFAVARPRPGSGLKTWFVSDEGRVLCFSRDDVPITDEHFDLDACRVLPTPELASPLSAEDVEAAASSHAAEALMPRVLVGVCVGQALYRRAAAAWAPDLDALRDVLCGSTVPELQPLLAHERWRERYEVVVRLSADEPERFLAVARPRSGSELPGWFVTEEGVVTRVSGDLRDLRRAFDLRVCRARTWPFSDTSVDPREQVDVEAAIERALAAPAPQEDR
ncbi:MAG: hypothetical protein M9894_15915 [Planctomycetes bacterium]|nr:hypothetical protein [Planctomycetota bacterium]